MILDRVVSWTLGHVGMGLRSMEGGRKILEFLSNSLKFHKTSFLTREHAYHFRFYFHLLTSHVFIDFEVVLSGEKWAEVDQSGLALVQPLLWI
jgi:hypothetical protein